MICHIFQRERLFPYILDHGSMLGSHIRARRCSSSEVISAREKSGRQPVSDAPQLASSLFLISSLFTHTPPLSWIPPLLIGSVYARIAPINPLVESISPVRRACPRKFSTSVAIQEGTHFILVLRCVVNNSRTDNAPSTGSLPAAGRYVHMPR